MSILETRSLTKTYAGTNVLKNISLTIEKGELLAIVGPSGSGKTTLLRILDLLDLPSSGKLFFNQIEAPISAPERLALRRRIGIVSQQTTLFNSSVYDNIAYPLKIRHQTKNEIRQRVSDALALVGLKEFERRKALTLSGGEMQRVALAQAIVFEPELLLLDEPTANLDPRNIALIENIISHVNHGSKITVVMATHNMFQAQQLADRAAVIREGELVGVGKVEEIFGGPSDFLASFARLDNVFTGISRIDEEGIAKIDIGTGVELEAATSKIGKLTIFVRPEEMILSKSPIISSARNTFKGKIQQTTDLNRNVKVKVDIGKEFVAIVTKRSFQEMKLNLGSEVYLTFKASSVHVI